MKKNDVNKVLAKLLASRPSHSHFTPIPQSPQLSPPHPSPIPHTHSQKCQPNHAHQLVHETQPNGAVQERCTRGFPRILITWPNEICPPSFILFVYWLYCGGSGGSGGSGGWGGVSCMCWKEGVLKGWVVWVRVG